MRIRTYNLLADIIDWFEFAARVLMYVLCAAALIKFIVFGI